MPTSSCQPEHCRGTACCGPIPSLCGGIHVQAQLAACLLVFQKYQHCIKGHDNHVHCLLGEIIRCGHCRIYMHACMSDILSLIACVCTHTHPPVSLSLGLLGVWDQRLAPPQTAKITLPYHRSCDLHDISNTEKQAVVRHNTTQDHQTITRSHLIHYSAASCEPASQVEPRQHGRPNFLESTGQERSRAQGSSLPFS